MSFQKHITQAPYVNTLVQTSAKLYKKGSFLQPHSRFPFIITHTTSAFTTIKLHSSTTTFQTINQPHQTTNMPTEAQIAGGHKANINNPNTSEESKKNSKAVLENEFNGGDVPKAGDNEEKNPGNVAGGLKA